MNRREAIKAITAVTVDGRFALAEFKIKSQSKLIAFVDPKLVGFDFAKKWRADNPGAVIYEIDVPIGKSLDDAIKIFTTD